jgi:hypothetical protein
MVASCVNKGHGQVEKRTIRLVNVLTNAPTWKGLKQGFALKRERTVRGVTREEVVHGITSLRQERAKAQRLLERTGGTGGLRTNCITGVMCRWGRMPVASGRGWRLR